ncbi:DUF6503 family protein [Aestuariivivens insulae]|uniref:DUF6503 family protein n=1 Tax=Aestuariivivens insulae TaxID=1621988 RepID=UPI001F58B2EE|nr:DUF6503 family protein [Aestuariivivens insulae]
MKYILFLALLSMLSISCKNKKESALEETQELVSIVNSSYPKNISKVLEAHGGLDLWNSMQSLKFTKGEEVTNVNLKSRKSLIETPNHLIGFNGKEVWTKEKDTVKYKGNAKFYYNLMFYFYAMPFVLADDGIIYKEAKPLTFEGKTYPGIKVAYKQGIGESPDDEYILFYDQETNKMAWLAYTVTYFSKAKSKSLHFINYREWQTVSGLLLPQSLVWYNTENNQPTTQRSEVLFTHVNVSKERDDDTIFEIPEGAVVVE